MSYPFHDNSLTVKELLESDITNIYQSNYTKTVFNRSGLPIHIILVGKTKFVSHNEVDQGCPCLDAKPFYHSIEFVDRRCNTVKGKG